MGYSNPLKFCGIKGCGKSTMFGDKFAIMAKTLQHLNIPHICIECAEKHRIKTPRNKQQFGSMDNIRIVLSRPNYRE